MPNIHARLAHMGIYVHDRTTMERFYTEVLGLMVTDQGEGRAGMHLTFMSGNPENHHQLVLVSGRPDTSGFNPIQQMSFMVDTLGDLREVHQRALALGATEMRPVSHGNAWSCYFKDPEGQHRGGLSRHTLPRAPTTRQAARSQQVGRTDPARDGGGLSPRSRLHADRAIQATDGGPSRRHRLIVLCWPGMSRPAAVAPERRPARSDATFPSALVRRSRCRRDYHQTGPRPFHRAPLVSCECRCFADRRYDARSLLYGTASQNSPLPIGMW